MELLPALANASGWAVAVATFVLLFRAWTREDLVAGRLYRRAIKRGDFWRDRALSGTSLAEAATEVVESQADEDADAD